MTRDDLTALIARVGTATVAEQGDVLAAALMAARKAGWFAAKQYSVALRMLAAGAYESAAMTLVPEGMVWNAGNDTPGWADVWRDSPQYDGRPHDGRSATPALALTAAALRARLAQMGDAP